MHDPEAGEIQIPPAEEVVCPPAAVEKPYPGFWQALGIAAGYFLLQIVFLIPFFVADAIWQTHSAKHPAAYCFAAFGAGVIIIRRACTRLNLPFSQVAGPLPAVTVLGPIGVMIFGLLLAEIPIVGWIARRFPSILSSPEDFGIDQALGPAFVFIVMLAPLLEETMFRGIMVRGFMARYGNRNAILISAALFGAVHFSLIKLITIISLGLILGWLYTQFKSIWPGVFAHALNNFFAFLAFAMGAKAKKGAAPDLGHFTWSEPVICLIGLTMIAGGIANLRARMREPTISEF